MREMIQSIIRLSWALSLFGLKQLVRMLSGEGRPGTPTTFSNPDASPDPLPNIPHAYNNSLMQSLSPTLPRPQREASIISQAVPAAGNSVPIAAIGFNALQSGPGFSPDAKQHAPAILPASLNVNSGRLDTSRFMVLGEGLAAGVGDFTLSSSSQQWSFPAQMARQMGAALPLPLIEAPGIGDFVGFPSFPVRIPAPMQSTVLEQLPPIPAANVAVPEFRLEDSLHLRPCQPLIHRNNAKTTAANLIWGILPIAHGRDSLPTQLEYVLQQSPAFTIIELGYYEALEAAIDEDVDRMPRREQFISQYSTLISKLKSGGSEVLALNIPDPFDTAYFSSVDVAAKITKVEPAWLKSRYSIHDDDLITLNGLNTIGFQLFRKSLQALPSGAIANSTVVIEIRRRIKELNRALAQLSTESNFVLYDLADLFQRIATQGYQVGPRTLSREYLGGFYMLNGYYPGQTGQSIIANQILDLLNEHYNSAFPKIDLTSVISSDPTAACRQAQGPLWSSAELQQWSFNPSPQPDEPASARGLKDTYHDDEHRPFSVRDNWSQLAPVTGPAPLGRPLQLPAGLEQVLPLHPEASYFGDAISALNVRNLREAVFGSNGDFIFGGFAMVDSHLSGSIKIKFNPPTNNISHFEISYMGGFAGEDTVLVTPRFFKMSFQQSRVDEAPGVTSSGELNLATGEVTNLTVYATYSSTALNALVTVNPGFPTSPVFKNPPPTNCPPPTPEQQRLYASAWAEFKQRSDGKLDFTFYGSMFVPLGLTLGPTTAWPLNFVGPSGQFATIPAVGMDMHPHLQLSTRAPEPAGEDVTDLIPFNTIQEFTLFSHDSAFGDLFTLNAPHLGGSAKGRSHLLGRLQIQFGGRTGNSVPIVVRAVSPGGIMAPLPLSPIAQTFPSRLSAGPQGFNEFLRFPMRTYPLDDLSILDDPLDISVGAVNLTTGRLLNNYLHRGLISQDLIFALLRVEPCTPQNSFFFRGPAVLARGARNQRVFRFQGIDHLPYKEGFKFPHPDFATGFVVGTNSALDPFLWFHAIQGSVPSDFIMEGSGDYLRASTGDAFSYRFVIPADPSSTTPLFHYQNHSQDGSFHMHSLAWVDFLHSSISDDDRVCDTVTFSGFGIWSKDGIRSLQQVAVQISTSEEKPYVGIQVASGDISNVNTKPLKESTALP